MKVSPPLIAPGKPFGTNGRTTSWLIPVAIVTFAGFVGALFGLGRLTVDALVLSGIAGAILLLLPANTLFAIHFALSVVISGCVVYFLQIRMAYWVPFGSALLLGVRIIIESLISRSKSKLFSRPPLSLLALSAFFLGIVISIISNRPPLVQAVVGLKNLIPAWAGFFAIGFGFVSWDFVKRVWVWLVALSIFSFPLVLYQHFVIGVGRAVSQGAGRFDAVVGTFGGDPEGGGHSATLGVYSVSCMVASLALYRAGAISRTFFWAAILTAFLSIVLSENKAGFVLIPLAFIVFDFDQHFRRPARFIIVAFVLGTALVLMYKAYSIMYYDAGFQTKGAADRTEYFFDPNQVDRETGRVGRTAALAIWWGDHLYTPVQRIFGYGPAASRSESTVEVGEVAKRYIPWRINATTVAVLLWDLGIFGFLSFFTILGAAVVYGIRRYGWSGSAVDKELLRAATATIMILMAFCFHGAHLANFMQDQFLLTTALGTVLAAGNRLKREGSEKPIVTRRRKSGMHVGPKFSSSSHA